MNQEEQWLLKEGFGGEKSEAFFAARERLRLGEPLAYLIGHVPFLGTTINLSSRPLIPRPETEYWVEKAIKDMQRPGHSKPLTVLDLCSGSGCIGVAVGHHVPGAHIDFVEINERHHDTIRNNIGAINMPADQYRIFGGDLFSNIPSETLYDYILTNPPYIDSSLGRIEESVLRHEPHEALFSSDAGFQHVHTIIDMAPVYLKQNGVLYIEHEPEHVERISDVAEKSGYAIHTCPDQYGVLRYSILTREPDIEKPCVA